ncbi:hypothetical protein [Amycolatopsis regifaucium]|uniref:hypothetical protein n=1 Tax=Amycolatopsis regifaucium TaxID=546365 RepID=UPI0008F6578F|nr:hypothetical protein [Amycolatopsis regifaucium]SFJ73125.1 hypothetical protein SAMN04489731_1357 [Amycolatopsis regifaucium]
MRNERHVQLRWESRTVVADGPCDPAEIVPYPGIAVAHRERRHAVDKLWLPVGESRTPHR